MKFSKREYILVFASVILVVFYLFYHFMLIPQFDRNQQLESKIVAQSIELKTLQSKVKILNAIQKVDKENQLDLGGMPEFLTFIGNQSALYGIEINSILPSVSKTGDAAEKSIVELNLTGGYLGLLDFLAAFEQGTVGAAAGEINMSGGATSGPLNIKVIFNTAFN
ncbi:MAG: hypothetical protein NT099_09660 [Candidatus Saganbacteria bacterium]|nr:hypothetical protein [Candidatus Saganbacteria bacterium]